MQLTIIRRPSTLGATLSAWYVNGHPTCYGVEDVVRGPSEAKVFGKTAIPAGTYRVRITMSRRFGRLLPELSDLPGKQTYFGGRLIGDCGIRIHPGNTSADTEGCLLPGTTIGPDGASVLNSRVAFNALFGQMQTAAANNEPITLTIR